MSHCIAYAWTGKEFEVMDELTRLGIPHWRGERIEFKRLGRNRTAEPYTYPALPNYVWIQPTMEQRHRLHEVRHLSPTMLWLIPSAVQAMEAFRDAADARLAEANAIIARAEARREAIVQYNAGDMLEIRDGVLRGMLGRFESLVRGQEHPLIEATVSMMGREVVTRIDPLNVRAAE